MSPLRHLTPLAVIAACLAAPVGVAQAADEVPLADSRRPGSVIAVSVSSGPKATASAPRSIVVTQHGGRPVTLLTKGEPALRIVHPGSQPAVFGDLRPGTTYTVLVGDTRIGTVTAVDRPHQVSRLVAHAGASTGTVELTWTYRDSTSTGGAAVTFDLTATSPDAPPAAGRATNTRSTQLTGLDPSALYTFTITPRNSAGTGRATSARMTRTLAQLSGTPATAAPATPSPSPTPSPTAAPTPPPPPPPATVWVCPTAYTPNPQGTCTRTRAYTYHQEPAGPAPLLDSFTTDTGVCPPGYNLEDYGWVEYCRLYGPVPMKQVKDATPAGFTDDGTQWVSVVAKIEVPA